MANIDEYKKKLSAVGDAIREKTGSTDLLGLDEMPDMIRGIISGGNGLTYDMGTFVRDSDAHSLFRVPHNLGKKPKVIIVWTNDFDGITENNYTTSTCLGFLAFDKLIGLPQRLTASTESNHYMTFLMSLSSGGTSIYSFAPNATSYVMYDCTEEDFLIIKMGNATYWRAGVEYKYFVSEGWF